MRPYTPVTGRLLHQPTLDVMADCPMIHRCLACSLYCNCISCDMSVHVTGLQAYMIPYIAKVETEPKQGVNPTIFAFTQTGSFHLMS